MEEIKVKVDKKMYSELETIAEERGASADEVATEVVNAELKKNFGSKVPPSTH